MTSPDEAPVVALLPTLPGMAPGIVGMDPCLLQCGECGDTVAQDRPSLATFIILSGYRFHSCVPRSGIRRCPDCLRAVRLACPNRRCKDDL